MDHLNCIKLDGVHLLSKGSILSCLFNLFQAMSDSWKRAANIYEFSAKDIDGNDVSLEKYR